MPSENVEMFLKTLAPLVSNGHRVKTTALAREMDIAPPSVTQMVQKLSERGYLDYKKYQGVTLTEKGEILAARMLRRHQLLETFLEEMLGLSPESASEVACRMEHVITDEVERRICAILGLELKGSEPDSSGSEDLEPKHEVYLDKDYLPLAGLSSGQTVRIKAIIQDAELTSQLRKKDIMVGQFLQVTGSDDHTISLDIMGSSTRLDLEMARRIMVKVE